MCLPVRACSCENTRALDPLRLQVELRKARARAEQHSNNVSQLCMCGLECGWLWGVGGCMDEEGWERAVGQLV